MTEIPTIDTTVVLTSDDLKLIQRSSRLLVMIMQPDNFERARHEGYTTAEHRFAWRLVAIASGANVLQDDRTGEAKQVRGAAKAQDKTAKVEPQKTAVRAVLEQVVVDADHDVDRKTFDRSGPPPPAPKFPLTVVVKGVKAGTALLTIRVTPRTADGRGSAMVGRTIFVDP